MTEKATTPSRDEIAILARATGLDLSEPYFSELVESYGHVHAMLVRMRTSRTASGDIAAVFAPTAAEASEPN